jgi:UDP-2-acetamido-3-amino-2,3-dideoxy-glucuronate N-acetyltransferase
MNNGITLNSKSKMKIAVVGGGYWGKNLIRIFNQLNVLGLICDQNETTILEFQNQYPNIDTSSDYADVLSREDICGVVIAAPATSHYQLARAALLIGKHVYVEKPLTLDEKEGEELIALAKNQKLVLMVGHLLQYHPVFACLRGLAQKGKLGTIKYIYSNRLSLGKIRREENVMWSFAPHDISMILSLANEKPISVSATGVHCLHNKIPDMTTTHLEFLSGLQAHIFVSWLHPIKEQKLVIIGDKKMAVFDDTKPWVDKLMIYSVEIKQDNGIPIPIKTEAERVDINQSEPLHEECRHFLECIINNSQPITDGQEGLDVLRVLNASQKSLDRKGCKIVLNEASTEVEGKGNIENKELEQKQFFVHPSSEIDNGSEIGKGTKIWHFSHILSGSIIGEDCNLGQNVVIGPDVSIGKKCKIQNNVSIYKGVTLEDNVFCGPSMVFTNIYNPRAEIKKMEHVRSTLVKKGATIGANSTIICGTKIGKYAFIGAGTVVTKNVPNYALVVGNPGKVIGWACECGERLTAEYKCLICGKIYTKNDHGLILTEL